MAIETRFHSFSELVALSQQWLDDYPDLGLAADQEAKRLLVAHGAAEHDVHQVYWHRFDNAQSSRHAFTGWAHQGPPLQSLSLPNLVVRRFNPADQDRLDDLDMLSGFYHVADDREQYDERAEVRLLPSALSQDFWRADFAAQYRARLENFWRERTRDFITLSRAAALGALARMHNEGLLSDQDLGIAKHAFAAGLGNALSPETLAEHRPAPTALRMAGLTVAGVQARSALRFQVQGIGHYLYLHGNDIPLHRFDSEAQLADWLKAQADDPRTANTLRAHFDLADEHAVETLRALAEGKLAPGWLGAAPLPPGSDPFAWLALQAQTEMQRHADEALTSNAWLRREAAIRFLSTLSQLAANLAPLGWPLALLAVASASTAMGLDLGKAVGARSRAERRAAISAAIGQGLISLLTLPLLGSTRMADWPWEVEPEQSAIAPSPPLLPTSPVSPWPLNAKGMVEHSAVDVVFAVREAPRGEPPTRWLERGLPPTTRFNRLPPMVEGPALRVFGTAEGALAHAQANIDGAFHLFRIQARGLRVASLRANLRLNRANTLAMLGIEDTPLDADRLTTLADGAWVEHEAHLAMQGLEPARLRLLSPLTRQPWQPEGLNVLRGVSRQALSGRVAPSYLIEVQDGLRMVRFDPFSESWRTARGSAFRYDARLKGFEPFDPTDAPEALAPTIEAATAELGIPATYPWHIAEPSGSLRLPLPRTIHSIWLGRRMPGRLIDNLLRNAAEAAQGDTPFDYHLYLAIDDPLELSLTRADLAAAPANLRVLQLAETEFFQAFRQTPYWQQYRAATQGSGINYASAADVLRYRLLHYYGGLYMDVDDVLYSRTMGKGGFAGQTWTVAPGRLLLNGLVSEPRLGLHVGFNTSNFGTLAGNPLLEAVSEHSYQRFLANQDLYFQRPYEGADSSERVTAYAQRISHVTGPGVFNDVLMDRLPDVRQFRSVCRLATELYVPAKHLAPLYKQISQQTANYCPLAWRIRIGATSSWLHTR